METATTTAERLERCFIDIQTERMGGIPILNPSLHVKAIGTREWQGYWLCVLLTPWFMNTILLPRDTETGNEAEKPIQVGTKQGFAFPAGQFEFIRGDEGAIGPYWMCSLFSPVLEFADQETAETAANAALDAMLGEAEETSEQEHEMALIWEGNLPEPDALSAVATPGEQTEATSAPREPQDVSALSRRAFLGGKAKEANS